MKRAISWRAKQNSKPYNAKRGEARVSRVLIGLSFVFEWSKKSYVGSDWSESDAVVLHHLEQTADYRWLKVKTGHDFVLRNLHELLFFLFLSIFYRTWNFKDEKNCRRG